MVKKERNSNQATDSETTIPGDVFLDAIRPPFKLDISYDEPVFANAVRAAFFSAHPNASSDRKLYIEKAAQLTIDHVKRNQDKIIMIAFIALFIEGVQIASSKVLESGGVKDAAKRYKPTSSQILEVYTDLLKETHVELNLRGAGRPPEWDKSTLIDKIQAAVKAISNPRNITLFHLAQELSTSDSVLAPDALRMLLKRHGIRWVHLKKNLVANLKNEHNWK